MAGSNGDGNGDGPTETGSWSCTVCGDGGSCVKGDEAIMLGVHMALVHGDDK